MNSEEKQILESRQSRAVIATAATRIAGALRVPEGNHCTSHSDRPLATSVTAPDPARRAALRVEGPVSWKDLLHRTLWDTAPIQAGKPNEARVARCHSIQMARDFLLLTGVEQHWTHSRLSMISLFETKPCSAHGHLQLMFLIRASPFHHTNTQHQGGQAPHT